jgi:hypothetical protein
MILTRLSGPLSHSTSKKAPSSKLLPDIVR